MTAITFPVSIRAPLARPSRLSRWRESFRRRRADARARRALTQLDARTLRDIGLTRQDAIFFSFAPQRR